MTLIPEKHCFQVPPDGEESEHLYGELIYLIRPYARAVIEFLDAQQPIPVEELRCIAQKHGVPPPDSITPEVAQAFLERDTELASKGIVCSWLYSFTVAGSMECGSDLLPVAENARTEYLNQLSNYGFPAELLTDILCRYAATMPEPKLPEPLVKLLALVSR